MAAIAMASLILAAQTGCGRAGGTWPLPPPPSEELRAGLGRVVVRSDEDVVAESVLTPSISGACGAAGYGVVMGLAFGLGASATLFASLRGFGGGGRGDWVGAFVLAVILFVFVCISAALISLGLMGGPLWGLSKAPSAQVVEEGRQHLEGAILRYGLSRRIGAAVAARAAREVDLPVAAWSPEAVADTYLDVSGPRVTLRGAWKFDAPLRLCSEVRVRLVSARNGTILHEFVLGHVGRELMFEQWVAQEGSAVTENLGDPDGFAARIVDEIFLLEVRSPAEPRP